MTLGRVIPRAGGATAGVVALLVLGGVVQSDDAVSQVGVSDNGRVKPCMALRDTTDGPVGGCEVQAAQRPVQIAITSVFGRVEYVTCRMTFFLHIGPDGKLAMRTVQMLGPVGAAAVTNACGDLDMCERGDAKQVIAGVPVWRGELRQAGDGTAEADLDVCLLSCLGRFEGSTRFRLERDGNGRWIWGAQSTTVGESGMEWTGRWPVRNLLPGELDLG